MIHPTLILALAGAAAAAELALEPTCGTFSSATVVDVNLGIDLSTITTIVAFGDGYTDGGKQNGTALDPAVQVPPNPKAGGRMSNGPLWVEYLADSINATLMDFAVHKSVASNDLYPNITLDERDFTFQSNVLISSTEKPDTDSTLFIVYEGMEDYIISEDDLDAVNSNIMFQILKLSSSPLNGKNFLVVDSYGRGNTSEAGDAYKLALFQGVGSAYNNMGLNVAFADLGNLINAAVADPESFGYESIGPCTVDDTTTVGECDNANSTIFYITDFPSTATHELMADYVQAVIEDCA
ncbi:hypothetical protein CPB85DRAFT_1441064 [Mucidula mucida]|nr:hypothetical protein CPB85DRAFT_1441064 [Mucidula mucida]